jgi:2-oxoglutarate ferredoxin oxidoreductase subunit delta
MLLHLDTELCKCCSLCVIACRKKVLEIGDTLNGKGYNVIQAVRPDDCIRCKICEKICPDFVIYVEEQSADEPRREGSTDL